MAIYHLRMTANPHVLAALSSADLTAQRMALIPGAVRHPSNELAIFSIPNFLDQEMCDWIMDLIDENAKPSIVLDHSGDDNFRTSFTCDLDHSDPVVRSLNAYIHAAAGIAQMFGEPLQGQRYHVGQEFKAHTDYFDPNLPAFEQHCGIHGQRTWTMMIYLNDTVEGGETHFVNIDHKFKPETGTLIAWSNFDDQGLPNPYSLHHGMPVLEGSKYIITKWFRERPVAWPDGYLTDA